MGRENRVVAGLLALTAAAACAPAMGPPAPDPVPDAVVETMPVLRVEQRAGADIAELPAGTRLEPPIEVRTPRTGERITLTATGSDVRILLLALADAAGVNLVLAPEVQGRVNVHFEDVPAMDALNRLIGETGYMITTPITPPWGPTVFYPVAVNVNEADAAMIRARFGVSEELARFIVRARVPPS